MAKIVEDITRELVKDLKTALATEVRVIPHTASVLFGEEAVRPTFSLHGPELRRTQRNYRVDSLEVGTGPEGNKLYDLRRHRSEMDLVYRLRLTVEKMAGTTGATQLMEKAIAAGPGLEHMTVDHGGGDVRDYRVEVQEEFVPIPTSDRSNVKEFEGEIVVEGADLRIDTADGQAHELIEPKFVLEEV